MASRAGPMACCTASPVQAAFARRSAQLCARRRPSSARCRAPPPPRSAPSRASRPGVAPLVEAQPAARRLDQHSRTAAPLCVGTLSARAIVRHIVLTHRLAGAQRRGDAGADRTPRPSRHPPRPRRSLPPRCPRWSGPPGWCDVAPLVEGDPSPQLVVGAPRRAAYPGGGVSDRVTAAPVATFAPVSSSDDDLVRVPRRDLLAPRPPGAGDPQHLVTLGRPEAHSLFL